MEACDQIRVTVLDENYIDMLLPDAPGIERLGMAYHFDAGTGSPLAENGIALLVEATTAGRTSTILLDAGLTSDVVLHNAALLNVDLSRVNHVVLSHGHPDHFGGMRGLLGAIGHPVPLVVHPDAFDPRYIVASGDRVMPYINIGLTRQGLREAGAALVEVASPLLLAPGITTSGPIEHAVDFEQEVPKGRMRIHDGLVEEDYIRDYQTLILNLRGKGLVVLDPCGHAGVISSLKHASRITGVQQVHGVMGGFHLGHSGISATKIDATVAGLVELNVSHISPMHCSGFRTIAAVQKALPDRLQIMTAGTTVTFEAVPNA